MDLDLGTFGRSSGSLGGDAVAASAGYVRDLFRFPAGGGGGGASSSQLTYANSNHRRSSFTEYRSLLAGHSGLGDDLAGLGPARGAYAGGGSGLGHHYSRDDTTLLGGRAATSRYSSAPINNNYNNNHHHRTTSSLFDKYSIHLDDNNNSRQRHHDKFSYLLGDNSTIATRREPNSALSSLANQRSSLFDTLASTSCGGSSNATAAAANTTAAPGGAISGLPTGAKYGGLFGDSSSPQQLPAASTTAGALATARTNQLLDQPSGKSSAPLDGDASLLLASLKDVMGGAQQPATRPTGASPEAELLAAHETVDSIEIPARGRCKVFMAKYGYDPFKQSPNDNPDAELAFNAGDYIMVFDDIDEDGYFVGELMDGRRGYVPSNWLYRLTGEDLFEFQANVLYKQASGALAGLDNQADQAQLALAGAANPLASSEPQDDCPAPDNANSNHNSAGGYYPPEFYDAIIQDTLSHSSFQHLLAPEDYHRMNDYVDLDDVDEVDDECLSDYERAEAEQMRRAVPPPQRLLLERQLNKCILIAWLHPQSAKGSIKSYQVYVDGVLKSTVPSGDRTKALLEGVDSNLPHRISVRAIDVRGCHSNDAACTIVIGQRIPFAPSCVKASHITSDSALISWLPCNSNFHHVVAVNSVELQTVRPGVYKHLINGLSANTLYRVWVRAKPGKILSIDEKNPKKLESLTTYVDFKTMPKSLPDPPVNVQVEAGPQRRTLLVTWLPLTLNDFGSSNGCAVTGYAVFAGHKKLAEIDSPTGDHALLDIGELESLHKKSVTVRTKSGENLSQDSMPCQIPDEYLKSGPSGAASSAYNQHQARAHHHHHQQQQPPLLHHHQRNPLAVASHYHASSTSMSQSPSRQRAAGSSSAHQRAAGGQPVRGHPAPSQGRRPQQQHTRAGRPLTKSLHNLESDLESRRSSIPAIEITRETSGSEFMANHTESYSEEEFESSMRFRPAGHHHGHHQAHGRPGRAAGGRAAGEQLGRFRPRQSHSVDSQRGHQFQPQGRSLRGLATPLQAGVPDAHYFVALFDYDPSTMSPNPNAAAEELAFKEGAIIRVHGALGEDGFYKGELVDTQTAGFVPCNVITEITDPSLLASLYEKHHQLAGQPLLARQPAAGQQQQLDQIHQQPQNQQHNSLVGAAGAVERMVALYDYDPQENSPNADTESEIPFKTGDIIFVYGKMDTDGFYMGEVERTKQRGLVPSNFLREDTLPAGAIAQQHANPAANVRKGGPLGFAMKPQQQPQILHQNRNQNQMMQFKQQPLGANQQQAQFGPAGQAHQLNSQQQLRDQQVNLMGAQQQPQPNINRPNSLSLGAQTQNNAHQQQMLMMNSQQQALQAQQQPTSFLQSSANPQPNQQQQANSANSAPGGMNNQMNNQLNLFSGNTNQMLGRGVGNTLANQPRFLGGANQQQQMQMQQNMQQQQQQQQQGPAGVLSNLLSSGKQIIGAATTPRVPNQPGSFPGQGGGGVMGGMMNQQQQLAAGGNQMLGQQNMMMDNSAPASAAMNQFGTGSGPQRQMQPALQQGQSAMSAFNQQQQPTGLMGDNFMQHNANFADRGGAMMANQPQQQQPYNQMGNFGQRPANMAGPAGGMNQIGDGDQGGNILNTVKNIFKL